MLHEHYLLPATPFASYREYLDAVGGDAVSLARARDPEAILDELRKSGLRGRGGAGFPTGLKWTTVARHACPIRYVVLNGAEGEPGTFKDRALLRNNPYAAVEGMLIAAHVVGARGAFIALKRSFTVELERLRAALDEMRAAIERLPVTLVEGPEEYLFGEEKALLNVIDGVGPLPRTPDEPPYEVGIGATPASPNPALVNNVETFAHVPSIVRHGAASFRRLGTADTPGTILFTLSGDLRRPGVYEREAGVPLGALLEEAGGGAAAGRTIKLVLAGVSAPPIPGDRLDVPTDFGSMALAGSGLGSAGFVALDDRANAARVAQAVARFLYVESCNQCSACKVGLRIASRSLDELCAPASAGEVHPELVEKALFGATHAPQANRCFLPVQASLLVPALARRFPREFEAPSPGAAAEFTIPKIVDWDERAGRFRYDEHQAFKQPDWTYREPPPPLPPAPPPSAVPSSRPVGGSAVRLPADLHSALAAIADEAGIDLDHQVEAALRDWLARRAPSR